MSGVLADHPWDRYGKPPPIGGAYLAEPDAKPTASFDGFTDAKGRRMTWEEGCEAAAQCVMRQDETPFIEELISDHCMPDEVLEWLVDPETGEFADDAP